MTNDQDVIDAPGEAPAETKPAPTLELTTDQILAVNSILDWLETSGGPLTMTMGGFAGTGKTTVIKHLLTEYRDRVVDACRNYETAAFTGKAANVLRRKGVDAQTLHSLIYRPERFGSRIRFVRKDDLECGLVIVDEASMVSSDLYRDLMSFGIRVLFVGDMGQLEPIGKNPRLMANPDIRLEKIHRQAALSDIIRLSVEVRAGKCPGTFRPSEDRSEVHIGGKSLFWEKLGVADQVICGFNETRHAINARIRMLKGIDPRDPDNPISYSVSGTPPPQVGDRVICLQNNKDVGVFNGMIGSVVKVHKYGHPLVCDVQEEEGKLLEGIRMDLAQFGTNKKSFDFDSDRELTLWDYGYGITTHKSQGSEWPNVLVLNELHPDWTTARWQYTAITRASKGLIYCFP